MRFYRILLILPILFQSLFSQINETLFPGENGEALLSELVAAYKPSTVLDYNGARDKMYALIDNDNDTVTCVYTGYKVYVPYNSPTPRTFTNAAIPIMNAEHTWPQSLGATEGTQAHSNLYHIFPTNGDANAARGNLPFAEIPDNLTDKWWRGVSFITSIPNSNVEQYSEEDTGVRFEPREDYKGNVARGMFYFYTMYKSQADAAAPQFFRIQKDVLYQWHKFDPADAEEFSRNEMIATYQDGKKNPFILDSTLVRRAYFFNPTPLLDNVNSFAGSIQLEQNYPNPFNPETIIRFSLSKPETVFLKIFAADGRLVRQLLHSEMNAGNHSVLWRGDDESGNQLASGIYFYHLQAGSFSEFRKMILLR